MTWFRVDDRISDDPKVLALLDRRCGLQAFGLWALAGSWASGKGTHGLVPVAVVRRLAGNQSAVKQLSEALVESGLWVRDGTGYRFDDWDTSQPDVEAARSAARDRMRRARDLRRCSDDVRRTCGEQTDNESQTHCERSSDVLDPKPHQNQLTKDRSVCRSIDTVAARFAELERLVRVTSLDCPLCNGKPWPLPVTPGFKLRELLDRVLAGHEPGEIAEDLRTIAAAVEAGVQDWPAQKNVGAVWDSVSYVLGFWPDVVLRARRWRQAYESPSDPFAGQSWGAP